MTATEIPAGPRGSIDLRRGSESKIAHVAPQTPATLPTGQRSWLLRHTAALDLALLVPMFFLVTWSAPIGSISPFVVALVAAVVTSGLARQVGVYSVSAADSRMVAWKNYAATLSGSIGVFLAIVYLTSVSHDRTWLPLAFAGSVGTVALHRGVIAAFRALPGTRSRFTTQLALLGDAAAIAEFDRLDHRDLRTVVAHRTYLDTYDDVRPALRKVDQLIGMAHKGEIDRVVVLAAAPGIPAVNAIVRRCSMRGVGVDLLTGASQVRPSRLEAGCIQGFATLHIRPGLRGRGPLAMKRVFDLIVASLALVGLAPVFIATAIAVKVGSPGPAFYKQRRLGRGGRQFEMIKFRSMLPDADQMIADLRDQNEADGPMFKIKDDPRITGVGRFIRRTSIDELPQLWNVLRGNMSLVGPRPALAIEADSWPIELFDRLEVSPGITGMWQVTGRSDTSFADYERLDLYYVDNWTVWLDIAILARTIPALLGRGAY